MKEFPSVSIIIVVYNGEKFIEPLLRSLQDQSYPAEKTEILLVDNGSKDNTVPLTEKFSNVKIVLLGRNYGFAGGNNRAVAHASHDLMVFLNVDTICHHHWLSGLVDALDRDPGIGACASNTISPGDPGFDELDRFNPLKVICRSELTAFGYAKFLRQPYRQLLYTKHLSGCSFIIKRDILNRLGYLFEEDFWIYAEDTDLAMRLHNLGWKTCVSGDSVVYHMHQSYIKASPDKIKIVSRAVRNRLIAFYKNMRTLEFAVFLPLLFSGAFLKILALPLSALKKIVFFIPFGVLSLFSMIKALFEIPKFTGKKKEIMKHRDISRFGILKILIKR